MDVTQEWVNHVYLCPLCCIFVVMLSNLCVLDVLYPMLNRMCSQTYFVRMTYLRMICNVLWIHVKCYIFVLFEFAILSFHDIEMNIILSGI